LASVNVNDVEEPMFVLRVVQFVKLVEA